MKEKIKTIIALILTAAVCLVALILDINDSSKDVYPNDDTMIRLYGEAHGYQEYYDIELKLWKECYDEGFRNLFLELPYYSAEFLNVWMKKDSDELIDVWFEELNGTLSGNQYCNDFFHKIKEACPETIFYGTDVGHQGSTTGIRYLEYLERHGLKDSENYRLAEDCIRQGVEFYENDTQGNGISPVREGYMVSNFEAAYERCGGGKIMGIYGSYHTDLHNKNLMAGRLKEHYGDIISSVKISSIVLNESKPYRPEFCLTGFLYLIMLFVPNIIWAKGKKPDGYDEAEKRESKVLLVFERIGQVLATVSVLIFPSINPVIQKLQEGIFFRWNLLLLITALVLMILYECYWIKYFKSSRSMKDMYSSFAGFPVAGATLPVIALLLMGIYSQNIIVIISAVILGIGHIGIHLQHRNAVAE